MPVSVPPLARRFKAPGKKAVPRHLVQAPAQGQHTYVHIRAPTGLHRQLQHGLAAFEGDHLGMQHALALHSDQGGGLAKRHAHLKACRLAGAVVGFLGQQIHAVMVLAAKPQLALPRHPHRGGGLGGAAL